MSELGGGVDELKVDLLHGCSFGVGQQTLSQSENSFLRSNTTALKHDEVVVNFSVMREPTHGGDALLSQVILGGGIVEDLLAILDVDAITNSVDFLVHFGPVMETLLTGTSNSELDSRRMPSTNTSDLAETLVRLPGQLLGVPTRSDTLSSSALGDSNDVNHLILGKNILDWDGLLKMLLCPVQLLGDTSTIQLDFHDVSLLLALFQQLHLSVADDTDDRAVLVHDLKIVLNLLLSKSILPFLTGLGECLLLGLVPVLVEPTTTFLAQVLSPDQLEGTETVGSVNVADGTDNDHWWSFNDGDRFHDFLLVDL